MTIPPTRLRVLVGLTNLLKTITPTNGYQSDLSDFDDDGLLKSRVFRGRNIFGDGDPLPMVSILEMPREPGQDPTPPGAQISVGHWELMIQGFVLDDKENPTDPGHILMADVKLALVRERMKRAYTPAMRTYALLGEKCVTDISIAPGVVRPPDETSVKAMFWLVATIAMVEDLSNPFA
jgi:hypothetical protein